MSIFGIIGDILGGKKKTNAVGRAGNDMIQGSTRALEGANAAGADIKANLAPFISGGQGAMGSLADLLGIGGDPSRQQGAIDSLQASPLFQSLYRQGTEGILQNASATGGLRGGNTQHSLANFSADTLAQVIQSQIGNLGNVAELGARTGVSAGGLQNQNAAMAGGYNENIGKAQAGMVLGKQNAQDEMWSNISNTIGQMMSAISGMPMGGGGGGGGFGGSAFAQQNGQIF